MNLGAIKDIVRDIIGRDVLQGHVLNFALDSGRREIEKTANFYWMRSSKTWSCVVDQGDYSITTSTSNGLNLPNFKDVLALFSSIPSSNQWQEVLSGEIFLLEKAYQTDAEGQPRYYVVDNTTLKLYPPDPDQTYDMKLWHFEWTSNVDDNTESDELTNRFPEALIYAACIWGFTQVRKDEGRAQYYRDLLRMEIKKIQDLNLDRMLSWRTELIPYKGAMTGHPFVNANKSISPWLWG